MAKRAKTGRINDEFAKTLALNVIILAPGGGDGSRVTPTVLATAA